MGLSSAKSVLGKALTIFNLLSHGAWHTYATRQSAWFELNITLGVMIVTKVSQSVSCIRVRRGREKSRELSSPGNRKNQSLPIHLEHSYVSPNKEYTHIHRRITAPAKADQLAERHHFHGNREVGLGTFCHSCPSMHTFP